MSKYYPITTRLQKLLTLPPLLVNCCSHGVQNSRFATFNQKSSNKEMQTACKLRTLHGIRKSRFYIFNQNSSKKETTHNHPCELLVNCEFALRGSESCRSSEPRETPSNFPCVCPLRSETHPHTQTLTSRSL